MPKGKGTYGSQKGRPRKDAGVSLMYQKRGPKYKRYSDVTSKTVATIEEEQKAKPGTARGATPPIDTSPPILKEKTKDVGSKEGEYKRRDKTAKHPEGHRAGDVGGHYKDYMKQRDIRKRSGEDEPAMAKAIIKEERKSGFGDVSPAQWRKDLDKEMKFRKKYDVAAGGGRKQAKEAGGLLFAKDDVTDPRLTKIHKKEEKRKLHREPRR